MSLTNVKRGDRIFVVSCGYRNSDSVTTELLEVVGVGPKYVTAGEGYKKHRFHRGSGAVVTDYSPRIFAYATQDEWEAKTQLDDLRSRCRRVVTGERIDSLSAELLERLLSLFVEAP